MDIQQYLESGIIEQYVLGTLTGREQREVEQLAEEFPEIRQELAEVQRTLDGYAQVVGAAASPPAGLRERMLAGFQQAIRTDHNGAGPAEPLRVAAAPPQAAASEEAVVRSISSAPAPAASSTRWLVAAAVAMLTFSAIGNYLLFSRLQETQTNLEVARTEQTRYAATQQAALKERDERARQLSVLRDANFRPVELKGTPKAPQALARVYFNPKTQDVYIDVRNLPALPEGKQYQLWALDNGKPVDAGVLTAATTAGDSLQQMKQIASAQAFAITVEDAGGVAAPTLSTLTVIGNI